MVSVRSTINDIGYGDETYQKVIGFFSFPNEYSLHRLHRNDQRWGPSPAGSWNRQQWMCWRRCLELGQVYESRQDILLERKVMVLVSLVINEILYGDETHQKLNVVFPFSHDYSLHGRLQGQCC